VDDEMRYIPFAKDYGPLNLAYTFEACVAIHTRLNVSYLELLGFLADVQEKNGKPICLYTSTDPKMKSNMALLVGLYAVSCSTLSSIRADRKVIVWHVSASDAFSPIAEMEMRMFRDAGNAAMEFGISIQVSSLTFHQ
jgi:cell division cycle 14